MKMRKRYLFFDIDGTLATGGYVNTHIPPSALLALEKLRAAGHFLALATGRSHAMAEPFMRQANIYNMVSDGGYGITLDNHLLGIRPLEKDKVIRLIHECEKKHIPWALQIDDSDTRVAPDKSFLDFTNDEFMKTKIIPGLEPENCENIYKAYIAGAYPVEESLEALRTLPYGRYHKGYFFVEPEAKGEGIKKVMDILGAKCEDVIVFGDSPNDLSMFMDDWLKVAMGNACPQLKEKADMVTNSVDEDGIYNACQRLGLF